MLSAQRGNVKAQRNISAFYYYGIGFTKDGDLTYAWASIANLKERNNENTQALLSMIIPELTDREESNEFIEGFMAQYLDPQEN